LQQVVSKIESDRVDQNNQKFSILLLITDGIINDMDKTIDQIVRGSQFPLGIIIVGVGDADFSNMDTLDGDD
jgi:vacuolar-type H+-ATPase subunit F/Vma7